MRKIDKHTPIPEFLNFVRTHPHATWEDFDVDIKAKTRDYLIMEEQGCLCGYTEICYNGETTGWNIEHYKKKGMFRALGQSVTFDWNNLIYAIKDNDFGGDYKDKHITYDDYNLIFNPVVDRVQDYFYYATDGTIEPHPKLTDTKIIEKVNKTVEIFNLNCKVLKDRRSEVISIVSNYTKQFTCDETLEYLSEQGFVSVIEQCFTIS